MHNPLNTNHFKQNRAGRLGRPARGEKWRDEMYRCEKVCFGVWVCYAAGWSSLRYDSISEIISEA